MEAFPSRAGKGPLSLAPSFFKSMRHGCRSAGLLERMGGRKGVDLHASIDHARERRIGLEVDLEVTRARRLAREADVADRRLLAAAEAAGHAVVREMAFDCVER